MLPCLVPAVFALYLQGVLKLNVKFRLQKVNIWSIHDARSEKQQVKEINVRIILSPTVSHVLPAIILKRNTF